MRRRLRSPDRDEAEVEDCGWARAGASRDAERNVTNYGRNMTWDKEFKPAPAVMTKEEEAEGEAGTRSYPR